MTKTLEESLAGFKQLTRQELGLGAIWSNDQSVWLYELPTAIRQISCPDSMRPFKLVRTEEVPFPDELRAFLDKGHPGQAEKYIESANKECHGEPNSDKSLCRDCVQRVVQYNRSYFIFVQKQVMDR